MRRRADPILDSELRALAGELARLHQRAAALGVFTQDRELLQCPACGLLEDVLIGGELITYREGEAEQGDLGLRFARADGGSYVCPSCGYGVQLP